MSSCVCLRYTYGKKVKGTAEIVVNLSYKSYELNKRKIPQHKITVDNVSQQHKMYWDFVNMLK